MCRLTMLVLTLGLTGLQNEPDVDNPEYQKWSTFNLQSWVTFEQPWGKDGLRQETDKLVNITKEKAVFESAIVENGLKFPLFEKVIWSKVTPKAGVLYAALRHPDGGAMEYEGPGGKTTSTWRKSAQGDEEIEVAGKKLKCHWIKMDHQDECAQHPMLNYKRSTKTWYSSEIPGGVAKLEITRLIQEAVGSSPETQVVTRVVKGWKKA